jgi:hypothetical protein
VTIRELVSRACAKQRKESGVAGIFLQTTFSRKSSFFILQKTTVRT